MSNEQSHDSATASEIRRLGGDIEGAHVMADNLLCSLLLDLGYHETVAAFKELDKWYA